MTNTVSNLGTFLVSHVGSHNVTYIGTYLAAYRNFKPEFLYKIIWEPT